MKKHWGIKKSSYINKKLKIIENKAQNEDNEEEDIVLPFTLQKNVNSYIYSNFNHIYFNNDINENTAFELTKELRNVEIRINTLVVSIKIDKMPIYLHLTTDGGSIYSAMSIIDCIIIISSCIYCNRWFCCFSRNINITFRRKKIYV